MLIPTQPTPPYYGDTQDLRYSSADQLASTLRESFVSSLQRRLSYSYPDHLPIFPSSHLPSVPWVSKMSPRTTTLPSVRSLASRPTVGSVSTLWLHRMCPQSSSPQHHPGRQALSLHLFPCPPHHLRALGHPLDPHLDPVHPVRRSSVSMFRPFYHRHPNIAETLRIPLQTWVPCAVHHRLLLYPSHSHCTSRALGSLPPALCSRPFTHPLRFRSSITALCLRQA
jgi:hypothetical protein